MFVGLRECVARSNPVSFGVKIPFDPNIIIYSLEEVKYERRNSS